MSPAATSPPHRIGLLGGSFDPPHLAHLALGRLAMRALALDELRWLPAGSPWQKAGRAITPGRHRQAMLSLLLDGAPGWAVDAREIERAGPTYTLDTVRALQAEWAESGRAPAQWFLVLGQDQFARFDTWHRWRELLPLVTLAVAGRDGQAVVAPPALAGSGGHWVALDLAPLAISASAIRRHCAAGEPVAALVGAALARYIDQHQLYRPGASPVSS